MPKRSLHLLVLLALIVVPLTAAAAADDDVTAHRLFHIERNKNANIVVYDAQAGPDSNLTKKDPVIVYWLKLAEGGERKKLKGIEKSMAYGFKVEEREGNKLTLKMKADVGREVYVDRFEDVYRAYMRIDGRQAYVDHIYIFADESGLMPKVEYLELFGVDMETGEEVYEKYLP